MAANRKICFVIMPFSKTTDEHTQEYWTAHFESFLKPLIEENPKLEARRSQALRGDVLRQINPDLVISPVVVADLTDNNSNVYWELGVRQSFKHGTVTIAREGTELPFDLGAKGTLFYDPPNYLKMTNFRRLFKEAIEDCIVHSERPDSHVLEAISGRGTLFEIFRRDEAIRRLEAVVLECAANSTILEAAVARAQYNQQNPTKPRTFTTLRFETSATELLITTRYVDEDPDFYLDAKQYSLAIMSINHYLNRWEDHQKDTEKWLLEKANPNTAPLIQGFRKKAIAAREKLIRLI